ncbi:A/G-specific adenine glycosylase [Hufsiella ginkgonis]|uniref:Adenine DNA glycosylase n=1 Tax=Hufsiella ginkgonis TaxID=2695274 RepID=A0A7K1XRS8_9SPHI|nr:A/G-specific adenine glycosylase [Hufsiella ginkgonis]MXV13701.1 A/G-specific adenine glycosylase [Hufsiella ginkgonis]
MNFTQEVISWYHLHKRDLPWRKTRDPYLIWLSEVILQQTRVDQGMPYYYRFSEKYPTVADFAAATEDEILKMWQGLGYYSRGRNMHHTAGLVMRTHGGIFPGSYQALIGLKGIGEYTAAAISSFAENEKRAVVDGNVFRVLSRYFNIDTPINSTAGKKTFTRLANELIDPRYPALYNQAIMEFGALQCRPKPECPTCPLRPGCLAYQLGKTADLPVKDKKKASRQRYFNYIVAQRDGRMLMNKRGPGDIWQNMYELPLIETNALTSPADLLISPEFTQAFGTQAVVGNVYGPVKHVLTHQNIAATFIILSGFEEFFLNNSGWIYVDPESLDKLAMPKLIFAFLKNYPEIQFNLTN